MVEVLKEYEGHEEYLEAVQIPLDTDGIIRDFERVRFGYETVEWLRREYGFEYAERMQKRYGFRPASLDYLKGTLVAYRRSLQKEWYYRLVQQGEAKRRAAAAKRLGEDLGIGADAEYLDGWSERAEEDSLRLTGLLREIGRILDDLDEAHENANR